MTRASDTPPAFAGAYGGAEVELPGNAGVRYQLQASADLIEWEDLGEPLVGLGEPLRILTPCAARTNGSTAMSPCRDSG